VGAHFLYSTNVWMKHVIQKKYRNDTHYVWCSDLFDSKTASSLSLGSLVPPSANPVDIYRELQRDVQSQDRHSAKITAQKATLSKLAVEWAAAGEITNDDKEDIVYQVNNSTFPMWRPLLYVIPRGPAIVPPRLQTVPAAKRAGFGEEYIIEDLKGMEFEIVEF
jgi:hypothetical protein